MKMPKIISAIIIAALTPNVFASDLIVNDSNLIGDWQCQHQVDVKQTQMQIQVEYTTHILANGNAYGTGDLYFTIPNMPKINYKASDNSTWNLEGDQLTVKSNKINFTNVSHPELDKYVNINTILPETVSETVTITELTTSSIKAVSEKSKEVFTCTR